MSNIKKNLTKTLSIITVTTLTFQSTAYAKKNIANAYPLKKDVLVFNQFNAAKEPIRSLNKNVVILLHSKDGSHINLEDKIKYPIKNLNGRTSIAVKDITEIFKLNINWNSKHKIVEVYNSNKVLRFPVDKNIASINNNIHPLNVAATISSDNNRSYLPIRYLLENLDYKVKFNSKENTINIYE